VRVRAAFIKGSIAMHTHDITTFFEYGYWARDRVLDTCARLADGELDATPLTGLDSIRSILIHTMSAEWIWRMRWQGDSPRVRLRPADFPTLDAIVARWREEEAHMRAFISALNDDDLARECAYTMVDGTPLAEPLW
jgi:uncharacterized damage-inducible protein DinB